MGRGKTEQHRPVLSKRLIDAVHQALDAGLSCDEVAAAVLLQAGLADMSDSMDGDELVGRCREMYRVMGELKRRGLEEEDQC